MSSKKKLEEDERFLRVQKDPRFWEMPEKEHKIKIDERFKSMFHDKRFKVKYTVDKRGRPFNHSSTDDLKRFYNLSDEEEEEEEEEGSKAAEKKDKKKKKKEKPEREVRRGAIDVKPTTDQPEPKVDEGTKVDEEGDEDEVQSAGEDLGGGVSDDDNEAEEESVEASGSEDEESELGSGDDSDSEPDLARGQGNIETSSDEDDDVDTILRQEEEEIEHDWGELCKDALRGDEVSSRLAVCNMEWDRIKAKDLLVLFGSFVPKGGAVLSVKIYPSQFGKERLNMETTQGPQELKALPDDSEDDTAEEKVYREKLRDYQLKRLKYFYAVVQCDSANTAAKIYEECDGMEYESSCSILDLRFIPDNESFDEEPKDVATDVNLSAYTPKLFESTAMSTSKVTLTWDETDHDRVSALNRKFNKKELLDMDYSAYLASSSEEEEEEVVVEEEVEVAAAEGEGTVNEEEEKRRRKKKSEEQIKAYRELLKNIKDKEARQQEDKGMEMEITWVPGLKETTEQLVKKKLEGRDKLTPWEEYLQKKKDKKKEKKQLKKQEKKADKKQGAADEDFSDDELPPDVDLSDPFFSSELQASDQKKKKKKKREEEERPAEEEEELQKQKAQMVLLMEDDDGADAKHKHFNYDRIVEQQNLSKKKKKKMLKKGKELLEDDHFQVDVKDPRFQAMFTSHLFNLDPSHPSFKKTRATQSFLEEKQRRHAQEATPTQEEPTGKQEAAETRRESDSETQKKGMDPSLSLLVKSIRSKTEQFQARKKQKLV